VSKEDAKTRILNYVKAHVGATEDDIAEDLDMHVINVLDALITLEKEGLVKNTDA